MKYILTTLAICLYISGNAQEKETIRKSLSFDTNNASNVFYLANINGHVNVEAYAGNTIEITAVKTFSPGKKSQRAPEDFKLGVINCKDTLIVYIDGVCASFGRGKQRWQNKDRGWSYDWDDCEQDCKFRFDFTVKVPQNQNLYISTINDGDIKIENVNGRVTANNINGSITLNKVNQAVEARTINGDVTLNFSALPTYEHASFYTLNGDIEAFYPKGLKANMSFKSFNGDFYTNIDQIEQKPFIDKSKANAKQDGVAFKIDTRSLITARGGGVPIDFETFNGNVYVREQ